MDDPLEDIKAQFEGELARILARYFTGLRKRILEALRESQ